MHKATGNVELMVEDIIKYLQKEELWETDTAIYANGKRFDHKGTTEVERNMPGAAFMWFEGPLNHALNYGHGDPQYKVYKKLKSIMEKHGFYPEFGSHCDFNIYPLNSQ